MSKPILETGRVLQIEFIVSDAHTEYWGKPSKARCKMAFIDLDNIQLEFIEPDEEESDWKKSLEEKGDCLHHIAFEVKGMKDQIASLKETGIECIQKGDYPGGRYAFMDTEKEYGEIRASGK